MHLSLLSCKKWRPLLPFSSCLGAFLRFSPSCSVLVCRTGGILPFFLGSGSMEAEDYYLLVVHKVCGAAEFVFCHKWGLCGNRVLTFLSRSGSVEPVIAAVFSATWSSRASSVPSRLSALSNCAESSRAALLVKYCAVPIRERSPPPSLDCNHRTCI